MKTSFTKLVVDTTGLELGKNMNMSGCKWYEKGINFIYSMLTGGGVCIILTAFSLGQRTANMTYNIVNNSDIVVRTYHSSYLLGTWVK